MTRWNNKRIPVIQQTGRRGRDVFVIWTLFYEIAHVINDTRGELYVESNTASKRNNAAKKSANKLALDTLLHPDGLEHFRRLRATLTLEPRPGR